MEREDWAGTLNEPTGVRATEQRILALSVKSGLTWPTHGESILPLHAEIKPDFCSFPVWSSNICQSIRCHKPEGRPNIHTHKNIATIGRQLLWLRRLARSINRVLQAYKVLRGFPLLSQERSRGSRVTVYLSVILYVFLILVCEAIGTAATPGLLCLPRVIVKMIVEKQMECRLAEETEVFGENMLQRHFFPSQNPTWPDLGLNPDRRGGKPATNRLSYGAAILYFHHLFSFSLTIYS
jgi:hypothetical protein